MKPTWERDILLEINDINVYYGPFKILFDISLSIEFGEIVTVIGPNGAGKTTLLRAISGIVPPNSGSIMFDGVEITKLKPHEICCQGLVHIPEGKQVFTNLSIQENLIVASRVPYAREKREESLKIVFSTFPKLKERFKQKAGTLSGGERQMLSIAMGLMNCPKIMLLDEPSTGLAPNLVIDLFDKIDQLCKDFNIGVLVVEQQVRMALKVASRGYLLIGGRIVLEGSKSELTDNEEIRKQYLAL